jgi:hypothetical protein
MLPPKSKPGYPESMNTQTVTIEVAPQVAAILLSLQKAAEAKGMSLDSLLMPLLPVSEGMNGENGQRPFHETATGEDWVKELYAWAGSHAPNTPVILDDSREAIYDDDER